MICFSLQRAFSCGTVNFLRDTKESDGDILNAVLLGLAKRFITATGRGQFPNVDDVHSAWLPLDQVGEPWSNALAAAIGRQAYFFTTFRSGLGTLKKR